MRLRPLLLASVLVALAGFSAHAQPSTADTPASRAGDEPERDSAAFERPDPAAKRIGETKISSHDIATAPINEVARDTRHVWTGSGRSVAYTATAGTLTIRDDEGKPIASMFYVGYVADHAKGGAPRPVTFLYNGGPGSSSIWLHMGSIGPVRVRTASPAPTPAAPFDIGPNPDSILDKTDLVFLDAIGTGFSRPLGDTKLDAFWGVDKDLDTFARAIQRYLTINDRWNSPKFLFGESYGTTRSAGLAYMLQDRGIQLNGVTLLSSVLNYGRSQPGYDYDYVTYLPSYAATAWYHNRLQNRPADLPQYLAEVRAYAEGPYEEALIKGDRISPAEKNGVAQQVARYTGVPVQFVLNNNLRISLDKFRTELLRDQGKVVGRYDSRFTGFNPDAGEADPEFDPSESEITGAFVGAFQTYLANELNFRSNLSYRPGRSNDGWDFRHKALGSDDRQDAADTAVDLAAAMRENPYLKLESLNGWYDLATPFFNTEYDIAHMELPPPIRANVRFSYYPSGHMVYLNPEALKQMKVDVERFYDDAAPR